MVRRACIVCGTYLTKQKLFCSANCRKKYFRCEDNKLEVLQNSYVCPYNIAVDCIDESYEGCERCGWYPMVSRKRLEEIKNEKR